MAFEIDTNVEFKTSKKSRHSKVMDLPFEKLEVGQSFHMQSDENQKEQSVKLSAWCQLAGKRLGRRFSLRTVDASDPRGPGLRVWRVEDKVANLDALFEGEKDAGSEPQPVTVKASRRARKANADA